MSAPLPRGTLTNEAKSLALITEAVERYKPRAVVALFSGGDDSLTATTIASKHPAFTTAAHMNTGIGVGETRQFVRDTCNRMGWPLREMRAKEDAGMDYEALVMERGFPGRGHHQKMYDRLKERPLRILIKELKRKHRDKIMLVTGVRSTESVRRMGHVDPIQVEGVKLWVAPIHDWDKPDCLSYLEKERMPRNPVSVEMHMSGECLCGAFAHENELEEWRFFRPEVAERIDALQERVRLHGRRAAKARCFWGRSTVELPLLGLPAEPGGSNGRKGPKRPVRMMCHGCDQRDLFAKVNP